MALWIGRPGDLVALPDPAPGVAATLRRRFGEHATIGGGRVVDFAGGGRREWRARWDRLTDDEYAAIESFHTGAGPWLLLPADTAWNYLAAGQATGDPAGYTTAAGTLTAAAAVASPVAGSRVLGWSLPANPTDPRLVARPPHALPGFPVPPGVAVTFTARVRATGPATLAAALTWITTVGARTTTAAGSLLTLSGAWQTAMVTAAPPVDAAYAAVELVAAAASVTAPVTVHAAALRLDFTPADQRWRPGRGMPLVALTELSDTYAWADTHDAEATFLEVG